jgi:hypothetical protein
VPGPGWLWGLGSPLAPGKLETLSCPSWPQAGRGTPFPGYSRTLWFPGHPGSRCDMGSGERRVTAQHSSPHPGSTPHTPFLGSPDRHGLESGVLWGLASSTRKPFSPERSSTPPPASLEPRQLVLASVCMEAGEFLPVLLPFLSGSFIQAGTSVPEHTVHTHTCTPSYSPLRPDGQRASLP